MQENEHLKQSIKANICFICCSGVTTEKRALLWSEGVVTTLGINLSKYVNVAVMSDQKLNGNTFCCIPCKRRIVTIVTKIESLNDQFKMAHK